MHAASSPLGFQSASDSGRMQSRLDLLTSARTRVSSVASSSSVKRRDGFAGAFSHAVTNSSVVTRSVELVIEEFDRIRALA
jgi:hypothetical protein